MVGLGHGSTEGATRKSPDDDGDDSDDDTLGTTDEQDAAAVSGDSSFDSGGGNDNDSSTSSGSNQYGSGGRSAGDTDTDTDNSDNEDSESVGLGHGSTDGATREEPDDDGDDSDDETLGTTDAQDAKAATNDLGTSDAQDRAATSNVNIPNEEEPGIGVSVSKNGGDISNSITPKQLNRIDEQTNRNVEADDLRLVDGELQFSREFRAEGRPTTDPSAQNQQTREEVAASQLEEQLEEKTGRDLERGEDFTVSRTEDGFEAETTDSLNQEMASEQQPGRRDTDIFSGVVSGTEDALSEVAQFASGDESTRVEFQGEGSVANVAAQEETNLTANLGPVSDAGDKLSEVGQTIQKKGIEPTAQVVGDIGDVAQTGAGATLGSPASNPKRVDQAREQQADKTLQVRVDEFKDIQRGEEQDVTRETEAEKFTEGAASGGLSILNLPAIGGTVVDAGEFAAEGTSRTIDGRGDEFAKRAGGQATAKTAQGAEFAASNPAKFSGQVAGGVATSAGLIGGAKALGGARAGRAASIGIQPGEELALTAARRGVPGTQRLAGAVGDVDARATARKLADDDRGMANVGRTKTITREAEAETETEAIPAEAEVPPRSEFSSREEYARELERARAKEKLPPSEEFPTQEAYGRELERARQRVRGEDPFETTETKAVGKETTTADARTEAIVRTETAGLTGEATTREIDLFAEPSAETTTPAVATLSGAETTLGATQGITAGTPLGVTGVKTETVTEPITETKADTKLRTDLRSDLKQETRAETRIEVGAETRSETSTDIELDSDNRRQRSQKKSSSVGNEFDNPVAKPGELDEISGELTDTANLDNLEDF